MKPQTVVLLTFAGVGLFVALASSIFISAELRDDAERAVKRADERYERRVVLAEADPGGDESPAAPDSTVTDDRTTANEPTPYDRPRERTLLVRDALLPPHFRGKFPDTDIVVRMTGDRIGRLAIIDDDPALDEETLDLAEELAVAYARMEEYEKAWLEAQLRIRNYEIFDSPAAAEARFNAMQAENYGSPWRHVLDDGTHVILDSRVLKADKEYGRRKEQIDVAQRALDARRKLTAMFFVYEPDHKFD